jgi:hypothetical protein
MTQQNSEQPESFHLGSSIGTAESHIQGQHTRGPWHYYAKLSASENAAGFRIYGASQQVFAELQPMDGDGREGEANARLIVAALSMLAEMQRYQSVLERLSDSPYWQEMTSGLGIATLNGYRAAIAKAKGWG